MKDKLSSEEIKKRVKEIKDEQKSIWPIVHRDMVLDRELAEIKENCPHENAYEHGTDTDEFEGRSYAQIICHDCEKRWEERIRLGKSPYPKWSKK